MFMSLYLLLIGFVSCLSSVLVSFFMLLLYSFRSQFSVVRGILFTESDPQEYISDVREGSLWASTPDCLAPSDILFLRTAGS